MEFAVDLLRYPDGERRELRRWWWWALGLGMLLGALGMQMLTWQVQAHIQLDALRRHRDQARQALQAEQARQAKMQQAQHEQRLKWQEQVRKMLDQQGQLASMWQGLSQSSAQHGVTLTRLQWVGDRWTLQGQAPGMAAVVHTRDDLRLQQDIHSELRTWAAAVDGRGAFQLEWIWPSPSKKP